MKRVIFILLLGVAAAVIGAEKADKKKKKNVTSVVQSLEKLLKPNDLLTNLKKARKAPPYLKVIKGKEDRATIIYRCRYTTAKSLTDGLDSVVSGTGYVEISEAQNMIIINDESAKIDELRESLVAMDIITPQVLVEAKVVEVLIGEGMQRDLSLNYTAYDKGQDLTSTGGITTTVPGQSAADAGKGTSFDWFPYTSGTTSGDYQNFNATLQWLLTSKDAKVLSSPNLVVSLGSTASIVTGQDVPIQSLSTTSSTTNITTEFKRVGVKLDVTPLIINKNSVNMQVNPEVSNIQSYESITQGETTYSVPVIAIRNIDTELSLVDGQILMIGGLYLATESENLEKTPFLSDVPLIGPMFTGKNVKKEWTQLIFFLKVNILSDTEMSKVIVYDPAKEATTLEKMGNIIKDSKQIFPHRKESSLEKIKREFIDEDLLFGNGGDALDDDDSFGTAPDKTGNNKSTGTAKPSADNPDSK